MSIGPVMYGFWGQGKLFIYWSAFCTSTNRHGIHFSLIPSKTPDITLPSSMDWLIAIFLAFATAGAYYGVWSFDFVSFDDPQYLTENFEIAAGLNWSGVQWAFTTGHASNWHPVTWLSHMLDIQLFGMNSGAHHAISLVLHILNGLLLFLFLQLASGASGRSMFVAALFLLHPLHVESVAWVSERKDLLSTFFMMLSLIAYWHYARQPGIWRYLAVFILLALGLMAKPMLVTLPFVLLLLDYWPLRRIDSGSFTVSAATRLVVEKLPLFILIATSSIITFLIQREGGAVADMDQVSLGLRLSNAANSVAIYIGHTFWPAGLAVLYPFPKTIPWWQPAGALAAVGAVTWTAWKARQSAPYLATGWLWFLGTLVPVIGLVQVGSQAMADRYTYIPATGLFIIIAWSAFDLLGRGTSKRAPLTALALLIITGLAVGTFLQVRYWVDSKTLWSRALAVTSDNYRAHAALGSLLAEEGKQEAAAGHFTTAIRIEPRFAQAHNKLGSTLMETGHLDRAVSHFQEALRQDPELSEAHTNMGVSRAAQGQPEIAIEHYRKALDLKGNSPIAYNGLGSALDDVGKVDEAITAYRQSLQLDPDFASAHNNLAAALFRQGQADAAIVAMREALRLQPNKVSFHYNLGVLLYRQGKSEEALTILENLLTIEPGHAGAQQLLDQLNPSVTSEYQH
jgi:tetratricopeptide (TPR) repeat protein